MYRSSNIVRRNKSRKLRWTGHVARMEEGSSAFRILTDTHTGHKWEGNIRLGLRLIGLIC